MADYAFHKEVIGIGLFGLAFTVPPAQWRSSLNGGWKA
jgi:hypothetical protein